MEVYGSVTPKPEVAYLKLPCVYNSGTVGSTGETRIRLVRLVVVDCGTPASDSLIFIRGLSLVTTTSENV